MIDFKLFETEEGLATIKESHAKRGYTETLDIAIAAIAERKKANTALYEAEGRKNALSYNFGQAKKNGESTDGMVDEIARLTQDISLYKEMVRANTAALMNAVSHMPNLLRYDVPVGDESQNQVLPAMDDDLIPVVPPFKIKDHVEIGRKMGCMDFARASEMSGSRFVVLSGALAKLERVLGQWMLEHVIAAGFVEQMVPHLVHRDAMFGTGQLPKFEEDLFRAGDHYLIPTAEVPLTNLVRQRIIEIDEDAPPFAMRVCALTPCYRAEAGSAGRDTRGLLRTHQFNKVEMVSVCHPIAAVGEHYEMLQTARKVLSLLGLPQRTLLLASQDTGFSAHKTFDIEVWVAAEGKYREIASISDCADFQARRMQARYKVKGTKGTHFVNTLNGSGVAVGRALLALMEYHQTEQGGIAIPAVLRERMGGSFIAPDGTIL